jgi:hypothetical protein
MQNLDAILHKIGATKSNDMPFRPVKCTEEKMLSKEAQNGFVYFTTDSHKIYCGLNGEYIPMGGTTGIYYGSRTMSPGEIYGEQKIFSFLPTEIESNNLPTVNDLILNVPDGGFYRVIEVTAYSIEAERLMIAGGGGGGTTGGGGTSTPVSITIHGGAAKVFASDATTMPIEFTYYSSDERENRIS